MPSLRDRCFPTDEAYRRCKKWSIRLAVGYTIFSLVSGVLAGIIVPILRFGFPPKIKAYVEDARLDSFGFFNATTPSVGMTTSFACNISVAFTVLNKNKVRMKIEYTKPLVATFVFYDRRLYNVTVADEGHSPGKRERYLLQTGEMVPLDTAAVQEFKKQNATGVFELEMRLSVGISLAILGNKQELALSCPLRLQVSPPGREVLLFREVICNAEPDNPIYF